MPTPQHLIMNKKGMQEFIRFCIVGAICVVIDSSVFYILHEPAGYRLAIICGSACGLVFNYVANVLWSFKKKATVKNAIGIVIAFIVNIFIVRFSLMWLFINIFNMSESLAFVPTLIISVITNFLFVRFVVNRY
jgi:putative flippase GtrA